VHLVREANVGYLATVIILIVVGAITVAILFVRHETGPSHRPSARVAQRIVTQARRVGAGDLCACGGTIGMSGQTSNRFGDLLGCTACSRSWTMDGRRIIRRRPARADHPPAGEPTDNTADS
jgi:hypothetical protein